MWLKVCCLSFVAVLRAAQFEPDVDVFGGEPVKRQPNEEFPFSGGEPERPLDNSSPIAEKEVSDPPTFDHPPEDEQSLSKPHPLRSLLIYPGGEYYMQKWLVADIPINRSKMPAKYALLRTPYHNRWGWKNLSCKKICKHAGDDCHEEATAWVQANAANCNEALFARKQKWHYGIRMGFKGDNDDFSGCYWTSGSTETSYGYYGTALGYWDPSDKYTPCNKRSSNSNSSSYKQNRVCMCTNKWLWQANPKQQQMLKDFIQQRIYITPSQYGSCNDRCKEWKLKCNEQATKRLSTSKADCLQALRASWPDYIQYGHKSNLIDYNSWTVPYGCNIYAYEKNFIMYWGTVWNNQGCKCNVGIGWRYLYWRKICACQQ